MDALHTILDHVTDIAAIVALTYISVERGDIPIEVITAITSIAIGARYAKYKTGMYGDSDRASVRQRQPTDGTENADESAAETRDGFQ